jgi:hypothetical protein
VAHGYTLTNYFDENELINRVNNDATNTWYGISFLVAAFIRTLFIRTFQGSARDLTDILHLGTASTAFLIIWFAAGLRARTRCLTT